MTAILEFDVHRAICIWLEGNLDKHGSPRKTPALAPGVEFWHTPNGGERRDAFEGKRLKEMGVKAGVHDLLFLRQTNFGQHGTWGLLFGMEIKKPDAKRISLARRSPEHQAARRQLVTGGHAAERLVDCLSDSQLEMHPRLLRAGLAASCVVDNLVDAKAFCKLHGLVVDTP